MNSPVIAKVLAALCLTWVSFTAQLVTAQAPAPALMFRESIPAQFYKSSDPVYTRLPEAVAAAAGDDSNFAYSIVGRLPPGLRFDMIERVISGVPYLVSDSGSFPTTGSTTTVSYRATDALGRVATTAVAIVILPPRLKAWFGDGTPRPENGSLLVQVNTNIPVTVATSVACTVETEQLVSPLTQDCPNGTLVRIAPPQDQSSAFTGHGRPITVTARLRVAFH